MEMENGEQRGSLHLKKVLKIDGKFQRKLLWLFSPNTIWLWLCNVKCSSEAESFVFKLLGLFLSWHFNVLRANIFNMKSSKLRVKGIFCHCWKSNETPIVFPYIMARVKQILLDENVKVKEIMRNLSWNESLL